MCNVKNFFRHSFIISLLIIPLLQGCSQPPAPTLSSHKISSSQLEEIREGEELAKKLLHYAKLSHDKHAISTVEKVGQRLILALGNEYDTTAYQWNFFVIEDKWRANAFCLSGGKVFIYSGLFPYLDNEDELAVVLAHEMIHTLKHHQKSRKEKKLLSRVGSFVIKTAVFLNPFSLPFVKKEELKETEKLVDEHFLLPYIQSHEYEADILGLKLMQKAGYNPQAGVTFWSKFPKESRIKPEYLSTHPSTKHRLERIKEYVF